MTYGPAAYLDRAFSGIDGATEAYVYGSWAARRRGEVDPAPCDVDVLVVGTPDREAVCDALDGVDSALGREVNITFVSPERWASSEESFLAALRERPLVRLTLGRETGASAWWPGSRDERSLRA